MSDTPEVPRPMQEDERPLVGTLERELIRLRDELDLMTKARDKEKADRLEREADLNSLQIEPALRNDQRRGWEEIRRLRNTLELTVLQRNLAEATLTRVETERLALEHRLKTQRLYYEDLANDHRHQINQVIRERDEVIRERDEAREQLKRWEVDEFDLEVDG